MVLKSQSLLKYILKCLLNAHNQYIKKIIPKLDFKSVFFVFTLRSLFLFSKILAGTLYIVFS